MTDSDRRSKDTVFQRSKRRQKNISLVFYLVSLYYFGFRELGGTRGRIRVAKIATRILVKRIKFISTPTSELASGTRRSRARLSFEKLEQEVDVTATTRALAQPGHN